MHKELLKAMIEANLLVSGAYHDAISTGYVEYEDVENIDLRPYRSIHPLIDAVKYDQYRYKIEDDSSLNGLSEVEMVDAIDKLVQLNIILTKVLEPVAKYDHNINGNGYYLGSSFPYYMKVLPKFARKFVESRRAIN